MSKKPPNKRKPIGLKLNLPPRNVQNQNFNLNQNALTGPATGFRPIFPNKFNYEAGIGRPGHGTSAQTEITPNDTLKMVLKEMRKQSEVYAGIEFGNKLMRKSSDVLSGQVRQDKEKEKGKEKETNLTPSVKFLTGRTTVQGVPIINDEKFLSFQSISVTTSNTGSTISNLSDVKSNGDDTGRYWIDVCLGF